MYSLRSFVIARVDRCLKYGNLQVSGSSAFKGTNVLYPMLLSRYGTLIAAAAPESVRILLTNARTCVVKN